MDILHSIIAQAVAKRAMLLEEWLQLHAAHDVKMIIHSHDNLTLTGKCECGSQCEVTVVISTINNITVQRAINGAGLRH